MEANAAVMGLQQARLVVVGFAWSLVAAMGWTAPAVAKPPRWVAPLAPPLVVARDFHPPAERWLPGHRGVDLLAAPGSTVSAARGGVVTFAGWVAGRGVVVISHGPLRTTYEPVKPLVTVGLRLTAGHPIGTLSVTGGHCPPKACLHWGLRRGDTYLDPMALLEAPALRLLPLDDVMPPPRPLRGLAGDPHPAGLTGAESPPHDRLQPGGEPSATRDGSAGALTRAAAVAAVLGTATAALWHRRRQGKR